MTSLIQTAGHKMVTLISSFRDFQTSNLDILHEKSVEKSAVCIYTFYSVAAFKPVLIGRMPVREPSWKYSANLVGS